MKPGDKVEIFEDPLTQKKSQGFAILVSKMLDGNDMESWFVKFDGDERHLLRKIAVNNKPARRYV